MTLANGLLRPKRSSMFKFRKEYLVVSILLFLVEVFIGVYVKDQFFRPYVGDYLVVILLYSIGRTFWNERVKVVAYSVLIFSFVLEILQYFNLVELLHLDHIKLARIVIGTSFAWEDLVAYFLGIMTVLWLERFRESKKAKN